MANGEVAGVALGGLATVANGRFSGVGVGGLAVVTNGALRGVGVGGLATVANGSIAGAGIGGLAVVTDGRLTGLGIGGLAVVADQELRGLAIAGYSVDSHRIAGLSVSPYNHVRGPQYGLAIGVYNSTDELHGVQIGLINRAKNNRAPFKILPILNLHL